MTVYPQPYDVEEEKDGVKQKVKKENPFTGTMKIKIPKYKERMKLLRDLNVGFDKDGEVETSKGTQGVDSAIRMIELAEEHLVSLDLTHKPTKESIKSLDDLEYCEEGTIIINQIGQAVLTGAKLGNGSNTKSKSK